MAVTLELASVHLSTRRLRVAAIQPGDAAGLAAYYAQNQTHLAPWEPPRYPEAATPAYWERMLPAFEAAHHHGSGLHLALRRIDSPEALIGVIHLSQIARGPMQFCYLGFGLAADQVGDGLMDEALRPVLTLAFDRLLLHRIHANHMPENVRSARLLRRLGFGIDGYARDYLFVAGGWRDHVLTSLINPNPTAPTHV